MSSTLNFVLSSPAHFLATYLVFANTFLVTTHFSKRNERQDYAMLYVYVMMYFGTEVFKRVMNFEFPLNLISSLFVNPTNHQMKKLENATVYSDSSDSDPDSSDSDEEPDGQNMDCPVSESTESS